MTKKILVVDDDDLVLIAIQELLTPQGLSVTTMSNGAGALEKASTERFDLVILDVIMPFEDGFTAAKELKADPELSKIPIIILTSFSQRKGETDVSVAQGMELEAEDYVEKPVSPQELLRRVDRLLKEKGNFSTVGR